MISDRLTKAIKNQKLSHAYIIEGDALSDKLGYAFDFARAILCSEDMGRGCGKCRTCRMIEERTYRDLYIIDGDERSVKDKDVEELQDRISKLPLEDGKRNIAVIDKADTMTHRAQNRILKSLEEPYPGTVIMLLTENSDNLLPTIKSRCQVIRLYDINPSEEETLYQETARKLIAASRKKTYFFEIKKIIEEELKDRAGILALLDALEKEFRDGMVSGIESGESDLGFYKNGIESVERARKDLRYNIRDKYVLSDLMLRIGG